MPLKFQDQHVLLSGLKAGYIEQEFSHKPWKNLAQIRLVVFEKNISLIPKHDVTEPKARLL